MSSLENQIQEGEDHDDTDSQELFESFMEITKQAENLESEANGVVETGNKTTSDQEKEAGSTEQLSSNAVVDEHSQGGSSATGNIKVTGEEQENVTKRLSKAVDELSDLEKQLSLMISTGSCSSPSYQTGGSIGDTTSSNMSQSIQDKKVASRGNTGCDSANSAVNEDLETEKHDNNSTCKTADVETADTLPSDNSDDVFVSSKNDLETSDHSSQSQNASNETADTELPAMVIQIDRNDDQNNENLADKGVESNNVSEEIIVKEEQKSLASDENINVNTAAENTSGSTLAGTQNQNQDDLSEQKDEASVKTSEEDNNSKEISSTTGEQPESDQINQDNETVSKTSEDSSNATLSTKVEQPQSDQTKQENEAVDKISEEEDTSKETSSTNDVSETDKADGPVPAATHTVDNASEEVDNDGHTEPQTPEIEILMTDESGISEHKSLDSLDVELENDIRPESPALSDEGIDFDARSLDDLDDDVEDTFDSGSALDLTSKDNHLQVERNRMGSNSSTVSEKEFRNSAHIVKPDSEEPAKVYMKGYLLKLGGSGLTPRNWRRRWFVLKEDNCLYYYKHAKDKVPCGVIVLYNYSITKAPDSSKKYCFKLNKGGARTYHFCAVSDDNMREWMVALMKAASAVSPTGTSFQILEGNVHNVSIPALSIKDPECHGYLSKKGHGIKSWKRRYCVLKNGYLYYYSEMSNTTALGVAKLLGYQIKCGEARGKHFCFYGSPPDDSMRIYHFSAETENDRERWMKRMEESIDRGNTS